MLRFSLTVNPDVCASNCFSCKHRASINFKKVASLYNKYINLVDIVKQYESLPWHKRLFKCHPDPEHNICFNVRERLLSKIHDLMFEFPCLLNPQKVIKGNLDICSYYNDRWPCGVHRDPLKMENKINTLADYVEFMMETQNENG